MLCNLHAIIVYLKVIEIMFYIHLKQLNSKINEIVFSKQKKFFFLADTVLNFFREDNYEITVSFFKDVF